MGFMATKRLSFRNLAELDAQGRGLTAEEARAQRLKFGANEILEAPVHPFWGLVSQTLGDPMIWFLLVIGSVFFVVGERFNALILFLALIPLLFMDALLHRRTQSSTASLRQQLASRSRVIRDGHELEVPSEELVPGDLVPLAAGAHLPADGVWEEVASLQVDESVLTGESFPMAKKGGTVVFGEPEQEHGVALECLGYAGTRVLVGSGFLRVLWTGKSTAYGEIIQSVIEVPREKTGLQIEITRWVKRLTLFAAVSCVVLAAVRMAQGHGWLDAFLSAATLALAAIPEEIPVAFSFFLGLGVYRLAQHQALVRRSVSVENIGRVQVICTDKTGTLTLGQVGLEHLLPEVGVSDNELLQVALAASASGGLDPIDQAIQNRASEQGIKPRGVRERVFPFTEDRKRETAWVRDSQGSMSFAIKGAPEVILSMSTGDEADRLKWLQTAAELADGGHKVLAVAELKMGSNTRDDTETLSTSSVPEPLSGYRFLGCLAFEDPARPEVGEAMAYCRQNGIRVLMITGDHPGTARAIAREVGIGDATKALRVLDAGEDSDLSGHDWREIDVVARCRPMQKLAIVRALKALGQVVAVTGDGVNDVPALQAADIGIAMGLRGTRSAREVSSIVLSDDRFSTIVRAIREGRQLFLNLENCFVYLLVFHLPFVVTAALLPLMGSPLLYLPSHVVWLELLIHPTALFAFQARPDHRDFHVLPTQLRLMSWRRFVSLALGSLVFTGLIVGFYRERSMNLEALAQARGLVLLAMGFWSAGVMAWFSRLETRAARVLFLGTLVISVALVKWPIFSQMMTLSVVSWTEVFLVSGVVLISVMILGLLDRGLNRSKQLVTERPWSSSQ
ncbi:MAG: Cation transporting ATPase [Pseudomonadota bacterium]|jgi:Ca2+-transporting ATPase